MKMETIENETDNCIKYEQTNTIRCINAKGENKGE